MTPRRLPGALHWPLRRVGVRPSRYLLAVSVSRQQLVLWERETRNGRNGRNGAGASTARIAGNRFVRQFVVSTSRYGIGQTINSNQTPLGLHRIARKIGGGQPVGTIFKSRRPVGFTWKGDGGGIVHRILWLEGLEEGFNRGGRVDTFQRFVYIHGFNDETSLGRPQSSGCVHMAASDLMPLYERLPVGTLVWIGEH